MNPRSHESPMDFEYSNRTGSFTGRAGFATVTGASVQQQADNTARKRPYSTYNSPTKPSGFYALKSPGISLFHPSTPTQPPLNNLLKNPAFTTLRKDDVQSSDAETSPEPNNNNTDGEATPASIDMGFRTGFSKTTNAVRQFVGSGESQDSPLSTKTTSPKKGQLALMRIDKKQNRRTKPLSDRRLFRRKGSSDFDDPNSDRRSNSIPNPPGTLAALFGFIETHPGLPHILSFYAQLLLNVFLVFFFMYLIYTFWSTIRSDVDKKSEEAAADILAEMAICAKDYRENRCDSERLAPALESVCNSWERCMKRDPKSVGRARVSAHTFAEIFNSFIEPISIKAMVFSITLAVGCFAVSNLAFGLFRNKTHPHPHYPPPHHPPATPQTYATNAQYDRNNYWTPSQGMSTNMRQEPMPSLHGLGSPTPEQQLMYH